MRVAAVLFAISALAGCAERVTTGTAAPGPGRPSAPMTEQDYEGLMEQIGPTYQALRRNLQARGTAEAATEARRLAEWFGGIEKFWIQHDREDAAGWAASARRHATRAAGAAAAGDAAKAAAAAESMGGACRQCHGRYREGDGQGGYRIKGGLLRQLPISDARLPSPRPIGNSVVVGGSSCRACIPARGDQCSRVWDWELETAN